jgi:hypothetical protein
MSEQASVEPRYSSTLPDGTLLTKDRVQADDLAMVYVGSWPYDTVFATVREVRQRVLVTFEEGGQTRWISRDRIAGLLRLVAE